MGGATFHDFHIINGGEMGFNGLHLGDRILGISGVWMRLRKVFTRLVLFSAVLQTVGGRVQRG